MHMTATKEHASDRIPYHVVNREVPVHTGPFTTVIDAQLCAQILEKHSNWSGWEVMDVEQFKKYLSKK
jgi:hypothetical protein